MTQKTVLFRFAVVFLLILANNNIVSQNKEKKDIPLASLLNKISAKHKIFFTYDTNLITNKVIQEEGFSNLNLEKSISLLTKLTPFTYDYLGNNYYVVYVKNNTVKQLTKASTNKLSLSGSASTIDSTITKDKNYISGLVLSSDNEPLVGATIQNISSLSGTSTNIDGTFQIISEDENIFIISFLGHHSKTLHLYPDKFYTIILESGEELNEVTIVGSRNKNRATKDTPVAINFINVDKNSTKNSQLEVNQFLQNVIPSFNATKQSGADGADHIDPATIRGLGPDQTLVLINGKRRHQSSLINLHGTRGRGNSGTDLNTIPISAIKRIELLRDGASAQYGSDAIAGVINVVLKDDNKNLNINSTIGFNNANSNSVFPNKIDGFTYKLGVNYGAKIAKNGFVNFSTEILSADNTVRLGTKTREKFGQAASKNASLFFNTEIPVHKNSKLYANGGFNYRITEAYAFTRPFDSERNVTQIYPNGFNPIITSNILDNSLSVGFLTKFKNWNVDINNTFGRNNFHYYIKNTLNATLLENSPTEFDAGGHKLIQNTTSVDFSKYFNTKSYGINIALGLEHRLDSYSIFSGEEKSYSAYDINGNIVNSETQTSDYQTLNGIIRPGGSQGFPGYAPKNEIDRNRSNFAIYIDNEIDFSSKFMLGSALRYEFYSDFGSTLNYKLTSRYKITSKFNIRGSFSTGFRAPSLAQIYYNLAFTNFIGNTPSESLLIANNDPIARSFNIDALKEEKAKNFSIGFTTKLSSRLSATIDAYFIFVKDRIILSGNFDATSLGVGIDNVQFFANGVDTKTSGLDIVLNWSKAFTNSKLSIDFSGNINNMKISNIKNRMLNADVFFGAREQQFLLASAPLNKFNLGINYEYKKIKSSLNFTRFSEVKLIDWQIHEDLLNFNNSIDERLNAATDIYAPKITTNAHISFQFNKLIQLQLGVNNLWNTYPTKQNNFTDSGGLWDAVQMGTNGSFYYTKLNVNL